MFFKLEIELTKFIYYYLSQKLMNASLRRYNIRQLQLIYVNKAKCRQLRISARYASILYNRRISDLIKYNIINHLTQCW